jgi:hypothetical protein
MYVNIHVYVRINVRVHVRVQGAERTRTRTYINVHVHAHVQGGERDHRDRAGHRQAVTPPHQVCVDIYQLLWSFN